MIFAAFIVVSAIGTAAAGYEATSVCFRHDRILGCTTALAFAVAVLALLNLAIS